MTPVTSLRTRCQGLFMDSVLALYAGPAAASVFDMGVVRMLGAGACLDADHVLHVVLEGSLVRGDDWFGPGCHAFEDGRALAVRGDMACVWSLRRGACAPAGLEAAVVSALAAAARAQAAASPSPERPAAASLCDPDHPAVRRQAMALVRETPAATAEAIFLFVQAMPYRFGVWQERASTTLKRGSGMCTTKANLQVALMRACGLEAGFVAVPISMEVLGQLMPPAWLALMRAQVRHFYGAVRLGSRWHAADASFTSAALGVYCRTIPKLEILRPAFLAEGRPFNPAAVMLETDPFAIDVVSDIGAEMVKPSRFSPCQFEALNTRLDRVQGSWTQWLADEPLPRVALPFLQQAEGKHEHV